MGRKVSPIFLVSGEEDFVGNFGKSVEKVCKKYKQRGMKDVEMKLYEEARHEILNELSREQVYQDILVWLENRN